MNWEPIATVPKDGSKICAAAFEDGRWRFWTDYWRKYNPVFGGEGLGYPNGMIPTHWMPLPEPPEATA